jgi:hypothetical protein
MNRIEQFEKHQIHTAIDSLDEKLKVFPTDDLDIARIKKILEYIRKYLKLVDPDLLNDNHINQLVQIQTQVNNCSSYISTTNKAQGIKSIETAISHLLTLPIQVKYAKESISSILQAYNNSIKEGLEQIDLESTKQSAEKIKELEKQLFENYEDEKGVDDLIDEKYKCIKDSHTKINKYYNDLLVDEDCIQDEIKIAKNEILETKKKIKEEAENFEDKLGEFKKYYKEVFGYKNEDGEQTIGLKKELDKRKDDLSTLEDSYKTKLEELEKNHKTKYETLEKQINSLVDGATSAGLAKAFDDESRKFKYAIIAWNIAFIVSIVIMFFVPSLMKYFSITIGENSSDAYNSLLIFILKLPFYLPFIWLAFYASKKSSENTRLKHEYIHKATLAKSYISYKNQIDNLQDTDETLIKKLLDSAIDTVGYNPSQTLDKNHNDRTPITELIRLTMEKTTELAKNKK